MMKTFFAMMMAASVTAGTLVAGDKVVLFDGKSLEQWENAKGEAPGEGWVIEADGTLFRKDKSGDILSKQAFGNFELTWEWKISEGGNSGVKYWVNKIANQNLGLEYQLIDDERHADALKGGNRQSAAIYDIKAAAEKAAKPVGEWNRSKVVTKAGKIEHWLNDTLVVSIDTASEEWKERLAASKFLKYMDQGFAPGKGKILLQDHGDKVWFRDIVVTPLED